MQESKLTGRSMLVIVAIAFAGFILAMGLIALEYFEGPSTYKETSYVTLAFKEVDGKLGVHGIIGVEGVNPTIVMRSSTAHQMVLTIVNHDEEPHRFIIDGLGVSTDVLEPYGKKADVLTLSGGQEGTYTYRDALNPRTALGEFMIVKVTTFG